MKSEFLRIEDAARQEKGMQVLRAFSLMVCRKEITVISGASVLETDCIGKVLSGNGNFDSGCIFLKGKMISNQGSMEEWKQHVTPISDGNSLIQSVSVVDNFFICSREKQPFFARDRQNLRILQELLKKFNLSIDPEEPVEQLNALEAYELLLLKAFYHNPERAVFLDRRRIALSEEEFCQLTDLMGRLKACGMTFLILTYSLSSHHIEFVDSLVIVRDAQTVFQKESRFLTDREKAVLCHDNLNAGALLVADTGPGRRVLELQNVSSDHLAGADMILHQGETAAVYYTIYVAVQELFGILTGMTIPREGAVLLNGKASRAANRQERMDEGVVGVEEFLSPSYLFENFTALENFCLPKGLRLRRIWHSCRYRRYLEQTLNQLCGREVSELHLGELTARERLLIKLHSLIMVRPRVLVCLDPYAGVDQSLRGEVDHLLSRLSAMGTGVILFSRLDRVRQLTQYTQYILTGNGHQKNTLALCKHN